MSVGNLAQMLEQADAVDLREGEAAYRRYHQTMQGIAELYRQPLDRVIAVFCALSPNSDYKGNLRSTASVLLGRQEGVPDHQIVVSTYNHCKMRAIGYLEGEPFLTKKRGQKIASFYRNILDPEDTHPVTIDGHMVALWRGARLTMKEAQVGKREYQEIAQGVRELAFSRHMVPCSVQAVLWFARKRTEQIKYTPQLDLFGDAHDQWNTYTRAEDIAPYAFRY